MYIHITSNLFLTESTATASNVLYKCFVNRFYMQPYWLAFWLIRFDLFALVLLITDATITRPTCVGSVLQPIEPLCQYQNILSTIPDGTIQASVNSILKRYWIKQSFTILLRATVNMSVDLFCMEETAVSSKHPKYLHPDSALFLNPHKSIEM